LGESVRRDRGCTPDLSFCDIGAAGERAAPNFINYHRASSIASCTELVSVALWTGRGANSLSREIAEAPLLFDYASARGYRTAYLSSQNLGYQRLDAFLRESRIDILREARHRVASPSFAGGSKDEDTLREVVDYVNEGGPAFVFAHLSNTHSPHRQVPPEGSRLPVRDLEPGTRPRYQASLAIEDEMIADFMTSLRATPKGKNAIVIYTSDHGEAWGEHHTTGHTKDLYAEEIDVPLWIDAPAGALPEPTIARMRRDAEERFVTMQDVSATVIDLVGGLDVPAWEPYVEKTVGRSLLRQSDPERVVLLSNCPEYRECVHEAFGAIRWPFKYHTNDRRTTAVCSDLESDPGELHALPVERCADLRGILEAGIHDRRSLRGKR
jgi:hypothetical protein